MFERFFTNWKSTLCGVVAGVFQIFGATDAGFTWAGLKIALPTVLLGLFVKDK